MYSLAVCNWCAQDTPCETTDLLGCDLFVQPLNDLVQLVESDNVSQTHFIFPPGVVFDAVLALALGLMEAADRVSRNDASGCESVPGELVPLEMFSYFNDKMGCVLHQSLANISFVGITVSLHTSKAVNGTVLSVTFPSHHPCFRVRLNSMKMEVA